jgi:hypothetical protein
MYYSMQAPRQRPLGYSTTAPAEANAAARSLRRGGQQTLDELEVRYVIEFRGGRPLRLRLAGR